MSSAERHARIPEHSVRAVVADAHVLVREGVRQILEASAAVDVVASVGDAAALREVVQAAPLDIVIIGAGTRSLGADGALGIAEVLDDGYPETGLLVLGEEPDADFALALFQNGVAGRGYLLKARLTDGGELLRAVLSVAAGGAVVDPQVAETVAASMRAGGSPLRALNANELRTLEELAKGKNNSAIAATLAITRRTVEHRVASVFAKLDLGDTYEIDRRVRAALLFREARRGTNRDS